MNILLISSQSHPCPGGLNTFLYSLITTLRLRGHNVDLLCLSNIKDLPLDEQLKIELILKSLQDNTTDGITPLVGIKVYALQLLLKYKNIESYDIIHTNCGISSFVLKGLFPSKLFIGTIHGSYYKEHLLLNPERNESINKELSILSKFDYYAVHCPYKVVTVSSYVDPHLPAFPDEKHVVIPNGVDTNAFQPVVQRKDIIKIATAGFLQYHKGYDIFLKSLIILKKSGYQFEVAMYGEGTELDNYKKIASENQLPVTFKGHTSREVLAHDLEEVHIFVQPSRVETFGMSVTEAMASACVPVCSNVGGLLDQVQHMKNGLLFPSENEGELAKSIAYLIDNESARKKLALEARKSAEKNFSLETMCDKYESLYQSVIHKSKNEC